MTTHSTSRISRRTLLTSGGALAASGVVLAACGGSHSTVTRLGTAPEIAPLEDVQVTDVVLLRTAMSVETMVSDIMLDSKVIGLADADAKPIVEAFAAAHKGHLAGLSSAITARGGEPYTGTNTKLMSSYGDTLVELVAEGKNKSDVLHLAVALEALTASTYQFFTSMTSEAALRSEMMKLAVAASRRGAVVSQLVTPGTGAFAPQLDETGSPAVDKDGNLLVATLPSAFGLLSSIQVTLGPVNPETGTRQSVLLDTPSLNSLIY